MAQAEAAVDRRGALAVFLSRWLFSPLGPYVNLLAGGAGMGWPRFTAMSAAGEAVWVTVYVGLGFAFAGQLAAVAGLLSDSVGLLTSGLLAALFGYALLRRRTVRRRVARRGS
jgi:membrane protein DedA with SNARE-associated domain